MTQLRISTWGIKNPIPVALLFIAAVLGGLMAYANLPVKQFPNVTLPEVVVTITQNGAAPAELETQVTRPIEDAMSGIPNVHAMESIVSQGVSTTVIDFELGEDLQKVTDQVRQKVDETRAILPREIDPPDVSRSEVDDSPIITYAVAAPGLSPAKLSWFVDDTVARTLQAEQGVARIARVGGVDREINVIINPDRMAAQGVTAPALNTALTNFDVDAPGGRVSIGGREQTVRVLGAATNIEALRALSIPTTGGRFVRLSDVADVGDGEAESRSFGRLNNKPVIGFEVMKTQASSDVQVEDRVKAAVAKLEAAHPEVKFTKIVSTVDDTRLSYAATLRTLVEGMVLAALVVWLFLRDWRSTMITAIAMPVALIPTFIVMQMLGFSLNVVTLLGLTLVIGILVDDAIVEIENIQKRVLAGARPYRASMEGADQIGLAVVATTAAVVVVFAPVSFMGSIPGQFFKEFGITVSVAVLFSLLVARLLTPLLAAYFLKPAKDPHPRRPMNRVYATALGWCLSHRIATLALGVAIFIASVALIVLLPTGVQPPSNPDFLYVNLEGPPGATAAEMDRISTQATNLLRALPETEAVFSEIGHSASSSLGGAGPDSLSSGTAIVVLKGDRKATVSQIQDRVRASLRSIPDARVTFQGGGWGSSDVQIVLSSQNGAALDRAGEELEREMQGLKTVADPRPDHTPIGPEIAIRPKLDEAARLGVDATTLADIARIASVGDIDGNVAKMTDGERRIPVRIRLPAADRANIDLIRDLQVPTAGGGMTALSNVADVEFQSGPAQIYRYNRRRFVAIDADLAGGAQLGQGLAEVNKLPIMQHLPDGVVKENLGQAEQFGELFGQLMLAIVAGISMIYAVLVLLFRSFFKPLTILSALPLAAGGAFLGLIFMGESLSLPSLIGLLMLLGLAAKNSILLVEYTIERERAGVSQREAIMEACYERARPIVMTTVAMAAGMLPTALALGKGSEFRQPMAVAVIGGLITSTILSLVLVPVVYELVDDFENWLSPRLGRLVTPREAPEAGAPAE
jgi:HAE1 family hydrophobic/amphiphilic exporter-1